MPWNDPLETWLAAMYAYWGAPYKRGAKDLARDGGLDAAGLVTRAARDVGLDLGDPDLVGAEDLKGYADRVGSPRRGDLVLFAETPPGEPPRATHVGVYLRPGVMIATHDTPEGVQESNPESWYWVARQLGYWRPRAFAEAL